MHGFLKFSLLYFLAAMAVSTAMRSGETDQIAGAILSFADLVRTNPMAIGAVLAAGIAAHLRHRGGQVWRDIGLAATGLLFFETAFTMLKNAMPSAMPFWADAPLAALDRALHLGHDPWEIVHWLMPWMTVQAADLIYLRLWIVLAIFFPILIAALDRDRARRNVYLALYAVAWIGIGNVLALPFLSGGPIYLEALHGQHDFAGLHAALAAAGLGDSLTGYVQALLLHHQQSGTLAFGSGISAFPSVHVAVAAVIALYLRDAVPFRAAAIAGGAFLGLILLLSVWLGWHYAVDGYVSIAVIAGARLAILRNGLPFAPNFALPDRLPAPAPAPAIDPQRSRR